MDVKIINRSVVPDRIVLYEGDRGSKNLVFYTTKVNDGVNVEVLNGYLEIEREDGNSDIFLLEKTIVDDLVYFTLPIGLSLTDTADVLSSQVVFENGDKSLSYRTKVFYIDVKYSVDGESSYEQVLPSVITQLETKLENAVETCENILVNGANNIKEQILNEIEATVADSELSLDSENPVQNKVITEALNDKVGSTDYATTDKGGVIKLDDYSGLYFTGGKRLAVKSASVDAIAQREGVGSSSGYGAITSKNVNIGVKAALTDANKMVLTTDEQASARETIGATKLYKHIYEVEWMDNHETIPESQFFHITFYSYISDVNAFNIEMNADGLKIYNVESIISPPAIQLDYCNDYDLSYLGIDDSGDVCYIVSIQGIPFGYVIEIRKESEEV